MTSTSIYSQCSNTTLQIFLKSKDDEIKEVKLFTRSLKKDGFLPCQVDFSISGKAISRTPLSHYPISMAVTLSKPLSPFQNPPQVKPAVTCYLKRILFHVYPEARLAMPFN